MKKNVTKGLLLVFFSFAFLFAAVPADAAYGLKTTANKAGISTSKDIPTLAGDIVNSGLALLGIVFFGIILYGGVLWMIARGDSNMVTKAKDTITHAIIGLAVVAGAYAITEFALTALSTGTTGDSAAPAADPVCEPGDAECEALQDDLK